MATELPASRDASKPSAMPAGDELPVFRFGLRQLLVFVSLLSLLMAAMALGNVLTALALLLAAMVVGFHVFGTAIGTQLRSHADRTRSQRAWENPVQQPATAALQPQPRSPWHERRSTPLPWLLRWIAVASLLGALGGAVVIHQTAGLRSTLPTIAMGAFSIGVVAGWSAFIGYSFCGVFRHGIRDAVSNDPPDHPAPPRA